MEQFRTWYISKRNKIWIQFSKFGYILIVWRILKDIKQEKNLTFENWIQILFRSELYHFTPSPYQKLKAEDCELKMGIRIWSIRWFQF